METVKISELRVGNWVNSTFPMQVVGLSMSGISDTITCDFEGNEGDPWEFGGNEILSPIPITEEWLLKMGFVDDDTRFLRARFHIYQPANWTGFMFCESDIILREVKYIHALQNLFYALTGEELTLEPMK